MTARTISRVATLLVSLAGIVVAGGPAVAAAQGSSGWQGSGLSVLGMLGVFAGIPIALFLVISLLFVLLPSWMRKSDSPAEDSSER